MSNQAICIHEFGGPEVLRVEDLPVPDPGPGEARVRHTAIGLNFIDTYQRSGLYPVPLPTALGLEAAGVVEAIGEGVRDLTEGQRVVYTVNGPGAYCQERTLAADLLVPLPEDISDETAAAVFLKGLTAWYLLHRSYPVKPDDTVLLYAAAGGVGSLASQWGRHLGARVIGIVGSEEKAAVARSQGCGEVLLADTPDLAAEVRALTGGEGVAAVYDSVGRDTFFTSLDCLRPHGVMVTYGNASGPVEPFAPSELAQRGSLYVTRPTLFHFISTRPELLGAADTLFEFLRQANPEVRIGQRYPLVETAGAHTDLESRRTTGSTLLVP